MIKYITTYTNQNNKLCGSEFFAKNYKEALKHLKSKRKSEKIVGYQL